MCLWCYSECASTPGKLKRLLGHGGNRTRDLWDTSPMLCQLSYVVKSVRVDDISELSLVPSISVYSKIWYLCVLVLCTQVNMMFVMLPWVCNHTGQAENRGQAHFQLARCGVTSQTPYPPEAEYITPTHTKSKICQFIYVLLKCTNIR